MKIKKIRKKLSNEKWLQSKYKELLNEDRELNHFYQFDCSSFFRGEATAEYNLKLYHKRVKNNNRRLKFVEKLLNIK